MRSGVNLDTAALKDARLLEKLGYPWGGSGRSRQSSLESFPLVCCQPEALAIRQGLFGPGQGAFQYEFTHRPVRRACGNLQRSFCRWGEPKVELFDAGFSVRHYV